MTTTLYRFVPAVRLSGSEPDQAAAQVLRHPAFVPQACLSSRQRRERAVAPTVIEQPYRPEAEGERRVAGIDDGRRGLARLADRHAPGGQLL